MASRIADASSQPFTTIMIRNIPRSYAAPEVARELRRLLSPGDFDFVYVPWDKISTTNMGFGFANLRSPSVARVALSRLADQPWRFTKYYRKMQAQPARVQGLAVNLQRFKRDVADRGGLVMEHAPLVLEDGVPMNLHDAFAKYCPEDSGFVDETARSGWDVQQSFQVGMPPGLESVMPILPQHPGVFRDFTPCDGSEQISRCSIQAEVLKGVDFFEDGSDSDSDGVSTGVSASVGFSSDWQSYESLDFRKTSSFEAFPRFGNEPTTSSLGSLGAAPFAANVGTPKYSAESLVNAVGRMCDRKVPPQQMLNFEVRLALEGQLSFGLF